MKHLNNYLDFFEILKEQKGEKIYNFDAKDPYEYKVEDDNWLARQKKKKGEWNNITGDKFKEAYLDSIKKLDDKFPNARSKDAPKRKESNQTKEEKPAQAQGQKKSQGQKEEEKPVQTQAKEEETKEVSYKRDNGETATGTVVGVNKDDKTVTIKTDSGKEFEKPFDKVEMSSDELNKMADAKPAETKKEETQGKKEQEKPTAQEKTEEKPAEPSEDNQQRVLTSSQDNPPQGLKQFFLADDKAIEYMKEEGADISKNGKTYVFPFPPNDKDEFVYLSGYNSDEEKIGIIYVGKIGPATDISTFDGKEQLQDAINTANDMKKEMGDSTPQQKPSPQTKPETGQVDQQARAKSKAADDAEDKLRSMEDRAKSVAKKDRETFSKS